MEGWHGEDGGWNGKWWSESVEHVHAVQLEGGGFRINIRGAGDRTGSGAGRCALSGVVGRIHAHRTRTYLNGDVGGGRAGKPDAGNGKVGDYRGSRLSSLG